MESSDLTSGPSEIGSLTAQSNEESHFVGSSSGVYFIKTVQQAFKKTLDPLAASSGEELQEFPQPEDTLIGNDGSHRASSTQPSPAPGNVLPACQWEYDAEVAAVLGQAPPLDTARELMMTYFKVWHPLFPFLHGPTFLQAMEQLYSARRKSQPTVSSADHRSTCLTVIFQCVFNLASHLRPDLHLPSDSQIESPNSMHLLLSTLAYRNDLPSLQALLASQLYLVAKMSLRTASTVGGCMLRSMLHAGLHRCPFRYKELSSHDRQLRKRVFWCAYAIDRYLSQALGLPLGIQDSDIDVCPPGGEEIHYPGMYRNQQPRIAGHPLNLSNQRTPSTLDIRNTTIRLNSEHQASQERPAHDTPTGSEPLQHRREIAFASYVESGKLTGRALELFHKSILVRSISRSSILFLITDVHKWWNSLSADLQSLTSLPTITTNEPFNFGPFFTVLYQHLILLINRPSLSLNPSTPEFCSGLQTCIGAAREILAALKAQVDSDQALFWPGFLSAAWMSGLVLAFACQLRHYVLSKGLLEISKCLDFLGIMFTQWETAKHCHRALVLLSQNIQHSTPHASDWGHKSSNATSYPGHHESDQFDEGARKRRKLGPGETSQLGSAEVWNNGVSGYRNDHLESSSNVLSGDIDTQPFYGVSSGRLSSPVTGQDAEDRLFMPEGSTVEFDLNMVDLLQGANFDNLFDMFGQQYPSF